MVNKTTAGKNLGGRVLLAKAFRSATVHGALSPTKVMEWKLNEALSWLTETIFRIDEAVFEKLGRTVVPLEASL